MQTKIPILQNTGKMFVQIATPELVLCLRVGDLMCREKMTFEDLLCIFGMELFLAWSI